MKHRWLRGVRCCLPLPRRPTIEECIALECPPSPEWLQQHPEAARYAGYIVVDGKVPFDLEALKRLDDGSKRDL